MVKHEFINEEDWQIISLFKKPLIHKLSKLFWEKSGTNVIESSQIQLRKVFYSKNYFNSLMCFDFNPLSASFTKCSKTFK